MCCQVLLKHLTYLITCSPLSNPAGVGITPFSEMMKLKYHVTCSSYTVSACKENPS